MSKNIMTSGIEMSDVIKSTGFPVPEDMEGKTFAEVVEGGGSGDITVEALSATENKVYTAPKGKAYSPVTVNVPTKLYAWKNESHASSTVYTLTASPTTSNKAINDDGSSQMEVKAISAVTETTITVNSIEWTRTSASDVTM